MRLFIFICFLGLFFLFPAPSQAQGHSVFCGKADSTAASQECLKRHLDSAQKRLNKIYNKLGDSLESEKLDELKELQQTWLTYRDSECMWEAERSETPSLKRVNELSCMARVTEDRADLLTIVYGDGEDTSIQREFGDFPRWMNAMAKDNPSVFWDYGRRTEHDLDCDGESEYIMQGIETSSLPDAEKEEGEEDKAREKRFSQEVVVAIAQNPPTGRPEVKTFKFPVMDQDNNEIICSNDISLSFDKRVLEQESEQGSKEESEEEIKTENCDAVLTINHKGCEPKTIFWSGKDFTLEIKEQPEEKN